MKRVASIAFAVVYCVALVGCSEPAADSSIDHVPKPGAPAADFVGEETPASTQTEQRAPETHEVRKEVAEANDATTVAAPGIPSVFLTSEHSAMCRVRVGDQLPAISLPERGGEIAELAKLQGKQATVVLFWGNDPWMSATALADLAQLEAPDGVAIVGVAVQVPKGEVQEAIRKAKFPMLLDVDGKAFSQVGMNKLPRIYVLNESGEILWFDIEYSQSTQRELKQTLEVLAGK